MYDSSPHATPQSGLQDLPQTGLQVVHALARLGFAMDTQQARANLQALAYGAREIQPVNEKIGSPCIL